ncbi:MAG: hypothetical protein JNM56_14945 [Planctomycetia bacterium]|nr:hypothetical protein [Planctomycetia bacterium]
MYAFACSSCQRTLKAPEEKRGAQTRCPFCKQSVIIPAAPPTPILDVLPADAAPAARGLDLAKDLGVTAAGALTSFATVLLLWLTEVFLGFSVYTISICCVVPAGAMLAGGLASTGYYAGARLLGRRPSPWLLLNMLVISVLTFFMIHLLTYGTLKLLGDPDPKLDGFFTYLGTVYQEAEHQLRGQKIGKLGAWGYLEMALEILGFAFGGFVVYGWLAMLPYCETCSRYLSAKGRQRRFSADLQSSTTVAKQVAELAQAGRPQQAIDLHAGSGAPKDDRNAVALSVVTVKQCQGCGIHWMELMRSQKKGNQWEEDEELKYSGFHRAELQVRD